MLFLFLSIVAVTGFQISYALFTSNASNIGNSFTTASQFPITSPVTSAALKINEFFPSPIDGIGPEWVEIFNSTVNTVDLTGWKIIDGNGLNDDIFLTGTISPNTFVAFNHDSGWLNTGGDNVTLINAANQEIDFGTYTAAMEETDKSIGRQPDGTGELKKCLTITKALSNLGC